jgi:hypothetical protein
MAMFLVKGKSADGDHQKPEKAPSVTGGAFVWVKYACL